MIHLLLGLLLIAPAQLPAESVKPADLVEVALVNYHRGKTAQCFATNFLDLAARKGKLAVSRSFAMLALTSPDLKKYPLVIFSGDQRFKLSGKEITAMRNYLEQGGFVIASAGCANEVWNASFRKMMKKMMPGQKLKALTPKHPIFQTLYQIKTLHSSLGKKKPVLYGLKIKGRLAMVYSPVGVNDTAHAGGDCCCCGGDEIREAHLLNANILAYVLTH